MQHSLIEVLIPWSIVIFVDLSVVMFFVYTARNKNSSQPLDTTDNILYNQRNKTS
jgi:hypothetical protein